VSRPSVKVQPKEREKSPVMTGPRQFRVALSVDGVATERKLSAPEETQRFADTSRSRGRRCALERANAVTSHQGDARNCGWPNGAKSSDRADCRDQRTKLARIVRHSRLTRFVEVATESDVTWTTPERSATAPLDNHAGCGTSHNSYCGSNTLTPALRARRGDAQGHRRTLRTRIEGGRWRTDRGRNVKLAKRALDHAVRAGLLTSNQWPTTEDGESDRK